MKTLLLALSISLFATSSFAENTHRENSKDDDKPVKAEAANGNCDWGVSLGLPGAGFGLCGSNGNLVSARLAEVANQIGNPCAPENAVALAALLTAPKLRDVTVVCE
jgi:hypothetical protein